jgi:hypothetical protein
VGDPGTVVLSRYWHRRSSELAYVIRTIAGAASRLGPVWVLVPNPSGTSEADGAFDLLGMGDGGRYDWPENVPQGATIVVDDLTPDVRELASRVDPRACFAVGSFDDRLSRPWSPIPLVPGAGLPFVGLHVPVHPMAAAHRHGGFGFTGYVLVLSDRAEPAETPPSAAAWLTAAYDDAYVVVVEGAVASAWKGGSLRGSVHVDTRMDLWRLAAHASVCVDLASGRYVARECLEALRFGTPIMVPSDSGAGAVHAAASGGCAYRDSGELVARAAPFLAAGSRARASASALRYVEAHYADPDAFVTRLGALFEGG